MFHTNNIYTSNIIKCAYSSKVNAFQFDSKDSIQFRSFSSRPKASGSKKPQQNRRKRQNDGPLVNEYLVRKLVEESNTDADSIQIRLMVDRGRDVKPEVSVLSLTEAINVSVQEEKDLVSINIDQDIPVVKCIDYNKFMYEQSKKSSSSSGGNKPTKQFSYKAGIEDDDLQRKAKNMVSYLLKGHPCQVTITSTRRNLNQDQNAIETTLGRLVELVGSDGAPQGNLKKNDYNNRGSLLFQPSKKKS
jgi:translation initiation factor IF-3